MASKPFSFFFLLFLVLHLNLAHVLLAQQNDKTLSSPFGFIKGLEGAQNGHKAEDIRQLRKYLQRFGYLNPNHRPTSTFQSTISFDDYFGDDVETAVKLYQSNSNLKTTGILDPDTVSMMMKPRCGVPDINNGHNTKMNNANNFRALNLTSSLYNVFPTKWPPSTTTLTWALAPGSLDATVTALNYGFSTWRPYVPFAFGDGNTPYDSANLKISFQRLEHGDVFPFDGPKGVLGHSQSPTGGIMHLDADEKWALGTITKDDLDLASVVLHEVGHLLGLNHSSIKEAIMWPVIDYGEVKGLNDDDVQGIRAVYGT